MDPYLELIKSKHAKGEVDHIAGEKAFFYVSTSCPEDYEAASELIMEYIESVDVVFVGDREIVVYEKGINFRLCEMAFQMNWHQSHGWACPCCASQDVEVCGHITFTKPIKAAF